MKLLILGAGGMTGHVIALRLNELGHTVTGLARRKLSFCETIIGDVTSINLPSIVCEYEALINCIGILNKRVDFESHTGIWLNSYLPHLLAYYAPRVIQLSTDCVFSGHEGGGYCENSFRSTDTLYGRSKALGELNDNHNLTIRTSIIGPDMNENGIGLFNWFNKQSGTVSGYTSVFWTGINTLVLSEAIHAALVQGLTGLYNLTNGERISKFDLLTLFNELRSEPIVIIPSSRINEDKSLVCTRTDFDFKVPSYSKMVRDIGSWIQTHKKLYTHYNMQAID